MLNNKFAFTVLCLFSVLLTGLAYAQKAPDTTNCGGMYSYTNGAGGKRAVTAGFGPRTPPKTETGYGSSWHEGVDIGMGASNKTGDTNAYSTLAGKVVQTGEMKGYGNVIIIEKNGVQTLYAHVPDNMTKVKVGDQVKAGDIIADYNGKSSGNTGGAHIHYETRVLVDGDWVKVDPAIFESTIASGLCPDNPAFTQIVTDATLAKTGLKSLANLKAGQTAAEAFKDVCSGN